MNEYLPDLECKVISIHWTYADVKELYPRLTDAECVMLMDKCANRLRDHMIDEGWDLLTDALWWQADEELRKKLKRGETE